MAKSNFSRLAFILLMMAFPPPPPVWACDLEQVNVPNCEDDNSATFSVDVSGINLTKVAIVSTSGFSYGTLSFNGTANTFTFSGVSFSNYRGFGSFTVLTEYDDRSTCEISGYVVECCNTDEYDHIFVEQTIPATTYSSKTIWLYGEIEIAPNTSFDSDQILLATDAQINLQDDVTAVFDECRLTRLCDYAWDGIILDNSDKTLNLLATQLDNSLRGIFASNNASISLNNASLYSNRISLYINNYSSDVIDMDGSDFDEIQSESSIVQHPSSGISMSTYFPSYCGGSVNIETAPVVIVNSENVYIGSSANSTNTFSNTNIWAHDNTFINVEGSQVFIRNNTFNATTLAVCAYDESKITFGGTATAQGNTARATLKLENSSFYIENNTIEADVVINTVDFSNPGTGTEDGGQIINNDFTNEALLAVDQDTVNSYLRVYSNSFTDYRISFLAFTAKSNGKLIFHSNELDNDGYNTYTAVEVDGCDGMTFAENTLEGPNPGTPSGSKTNLGVEWVGTEDVDIYGNTIRYFNRGIHLSDDNSGTQLICNAFLNNYYQIFLDNTTIDDQGSASESSGNCYSHMFAPPTNPYYAEHVSGTSTQPVSTTWYVSTTFSSTLCENIPMTMGNPIDPYVTINHNNPAADCNVSIPNKVKIEDSKAVLDAYPNPSSDKIIVEGTNGGTLQLISVDRSIIRTYKSKRDNLIIDVSDLPAGIYILAGEKNIKVSIY